jgi:hypothetical protein
MSLRPEIFGFRLAQLRELLGSGRREILPALNEELAALAENDPFAEPEDDEENVFEAAKAIVERAVVEGVPFPDLEAEDDAHVTAAIALARYQQSWKDTGSDIWQMGAFEELDDDAADSWPPQARPLFDCFLNGRPLFGERIETDWTYYGYLTAEEVRTLAAAIAQMRETDAEFADPDYLDGFLDALTGWLSSIVEDDLDLWFFAV